MKMLFRSQFLLWAAVLALVPSASAQMPVAQLLARVSQTYRNLRTYEIQATENFSAPTGGGFNQAQTKLLLAEDEGGKLHLERDTSNSKLVIVSNGENTWTYAPDVHQYTVQAVAADPGSGEEGEDSEDPVSTTENLLVGRYRGLERYADSATLARVDKVKAGGSKIDCYVVEMQIKNSRVDLWIDKERFVILRQQQATASGVSARLEIRQFAATGPLDADLFSFQPPPRSREVEVLNVPGLPASLVGKPARDFKLKDLDGNEVALSELQGKVVLLDFWATWCPPCRKELPSIAKLYAAYHDKDVVVLGINKEDRGTVKRYLDKNGLALTVLMDSGGKVHSQYGCHAIPTVIVVNRQGTVTAQFVGGRSEDELRAALKVAGAPAD